jgi:ferric-dicitrate binding protein FerR (iron transport regulator)
MKKTDINSIDDLVASESFRKWIIEKDEAEGLYWNQWIEQNPARIEWVATARAIITTLTESLPALPDAAIDAEAALIQQKILAAGTGYYNEEPPYLSAADPGFGEDAKVVPIFSTRLKFALTTAASLLVLFAGYLLLEKDTPHTATANAYEQFLQETKNKSFEYNNSSDSVQRIVLSDGSEVLLEKDSKLSYAANFTSGKREVYLTGNAFFKITRNPSRPFIVYTQDIVTKVLGTSFRVRALAGEKVVSVLVKTGKVSVFRRENFTSSDARSGTLKGIVLTPNQEMVYDIVHEQMNKSLVETPVITRDSAYNFVFDDTPAADVFRKLHDAYGITVVMDEEALASCTISASLGNESFYEKLNIICKIINATYQVIDGNVVINAKGCR